MARKRKRFGVLINGNAGTARGLDKDSLKTELLRIAKEHHSDIDLVIGDGKTIAAEIERLKRDQTIDALIVGGGDGTVSTSAAQAIKAGLVLGVLPLGTMNYFARALSIPLDPIQAFTSLLEGRRTVVDTGTINGEPFLYAVSLGLQPDMIKERKSISYKSRLGKIRASTQAFFRAITRAQRIMLDIKMEERHLTYKTSALIISNNVMADSLPPIPVRLDEGVLGIYAVKSHHWFDLLRLTKDAAMGQWKDNPSVDTHTAQSLTIERSSRRHHDLTVSVDGELRKLSGKVEIEIKPKSLEVLVPQ